MGEQETFDLIDLGGPAWVRLESAAFRMGSDSARGDARPVHDVRLSEFRISRHPVTGQQRRLSACVDYEPALGFPRLTLGVSKLHPDGFIAVEDHFRDLVALQHRDPLGLGVFQQYLVELRTPYLIRVGVPLACLFEVPTPRCVAAAPDHGCPVLGQKSRALHGGQRAQFLQDWDG